MSAGPVRPRRRAGEPARRAPRAAAEQCRAAKPRHAGDALRDAELPARDLSRLRGALHRWYARHARELPWRRTRDPYRILVSELMLQQTRVQTVIPYYARFLARFPDVHALATAPLEHVLAAWSGLGYYRRARHLHAAARAIVADHAGRVPADAARLRGLPGIGRYTAAAVASMAFGESVAALDGNISRVLARLAAVEQPIDAAVTRRLWRLAERLLAARASPGRQPSAGVRQASPGVRQASPDAQRASSSVQQAARSARREAPDAGLHNQALMELGALVCLPRAPRCDACPVRRWCRAAAAGRQHDIPRKPAKGASPHLERAAAAMVERDRVLMARRPEGGLLAGMWELPGAALEGGADGAGALKLELRRRFGLECRVLERLGVVRHVFTHRTMAVQVYRCRRVAGRVRGRAGLQWCDASRLRELPLARIDRNMLALLG